MSEKTAPKKANSVIVIAILAVFVVLAILVFFGKRGSDEDVTSRQSESTVATVSEERRSPGRVVAAGVICPSFTMERQTCVFDEKPTMGFGSSVGGKHFCYEIPYGPSESYSRERWDPASKKWAPWLIQDEPGVVFQQRFSGNAKGETVAVTYWLSDRPCARPDVEATPAPT